MDRHLRKGVVMGGALRRTSWVAGWLLGAAALVRADAPPPDAAPVPAPPAPEPVVVGRIEGSDVNLRIGPRTDGRPVAELEDGDVVLVVERVGDWRGVRVPKGFPAAISLDYGEVEGPDALRITGSNVNLRLHPPEEGKSPPPAFRDRPPRGTVLTLIETRGPWAWVVAPEDVRAYVNARYVRELGPAEEHAALLASARAKRDEEARRLSVARRGQLAEQAGKVLMTEVSAVQEGLQRLRRDGNRDKMPVVALADRLDLAIGAAAIAPGRLLTIARALREDLEREIAITVARQDAEMARLKGLPRKPVPTPAPAKAEVEVVGVVRFEETPGWKDPGVHLLWIEDVPSYALRLTVGADLPLPDLRDHADGRLRRIRGVQGGDRLFGFPIIDVKSVKPVEVPLPVPPGGPR